MPQDRERTRPKGSDSDRKVSIAEALSLAVTHHRQGRLEEAETLYRRILSVAPDQPDALHLLGVLGHQQGHGREAADLIRRSLAIEPEQPAALTNLGNVLLAQKRLEEAAEAYRSAIALQPGHADAHCNLGVVLRALGDPANAEIAYRRAIEADPRHREAYNNLANLLASQGRNEEAITCYYATASLGPMSQETRRLIAIAFCLTGRPDKAVEIVQEWLRDEPGDPVAQHMLAACSGADVPQRASNDYIQETFDGFANSFDAKLAQLEYRAPGLVAAALSRHSNSASGLSCLDAGCGTGLCGPLIASFAERLIGVDLSARMLEHALNRGVYDELVKAELTAYLASRPADFDVIVSADTLVYFGGLEDVVSAAARALRPGGLLIFTVEEAKDDDAGHRLNPHGRYSHGRSYVRRVLEDAGLAAIEMDAAVLRQEGGKPVDGLVVTARRPVS